MIFLGDIAIPNDRVFGDFSGDKIFKNKISVANLEGGINCGYDIGLDSNFCFNSCAVIDHLHRLNVKVVSLANNHITDIGRSPRITKEKLTENNIRSCGAGDSIDEASQPVIYEQNGNTYVFLAFGWEVINCIPATRSTGGINPLIPDHVFNSVKFCRERYPDAFIILLMHWGYELERFPLPMQRKLAFDLVDFGVNAIIGHHSHCVQGIEIYNNAPIVYSLGNWFFPQEVYNSGRVRFPDYSLRQIAFEWNPLSNEMLCHWFTYKRTGHTVVYDTSEVFEESERIRSLTPYVDMNHKDYITWFKKNRIKKKFLPVYKDHNERLKNSMFDAWVGLRHKIIKIVR